jgi:Fic-DOC domain mobile mystery protein B
MTDPEDGATPLDPDELHGLRLRHIASQEQLNLAEIRNIARALADRRWYSLSTSDLLDDHVLRVLHRAMFGEVWEWAGRYRTTEKNIGCDPTEIAIRVRELCEAAKYWFSDTESLDEAGCKFHHQLVSIHPFVNGNGRHSRLATDLLMQSAGGFAFTWGRVNLVTPSDTRTAYIAALRAADRGDIGPLLAFVRA